MEILTLPEPGRTLFLKTRPLLIRGCGLAEQRRPPRSVFAGGTILAARWQHRKSKDVDIRATLQGRNGVISRLRQTPAMEETWNRWLQEAGMTPLKWHSAYKVTTQLRGREGETDPELEIGEFRAPLEQEVTQARVEGHSVCVASNASILAGKWWGRRATAPVRDLYDITVAGWRDPKSLQRALQTGGEGGGINEFLKKMTAERDQYREEAKEGEELRGTTDEYEKAARNPAWWAGWTVAEWAITELRVERTSEGWKTSTLCKATPEGEDWAVHETIEDAAAFAQWVGQLRDEERDRLMEDGRRDGGRASSGSGAGITVEMTQSVNVSREGAVTLMECGQVVGQAPSMEAGAEMGVEQGIWNRTSLPDVMEQLEVARSLALTQARTSHG